jgi:hypothetical protein
MTGGWIIANADETAFRAWHMGPIWTDSRDKALRFARREDAETFAREDEDAWKILPVGVVTEKAVADAMQSAWDEICSDTGCHPLDIEHEGRKLFFKPSHWARLTALRLDGLQLSTLSQSNAVMVAALRGLSSAAENFKAYAEGEYGVGRGSADEDDHNITDLDATIEAADAALAGHTAGVVCVERELLETVAGIVEHFMRTCSTYSQSQSEAITRRLRALLEGGKQSHG